MIARMAAPIDFWFDFVSPYAYFGATQIGPLAARHGRTVRWRPFLLGVTVMKVMGQRPLMEVPLKSDYLRHDKPRMARLLGVPFVDRDLGGVSGVVAARAFLWLERERADLAVPFALRIFDRLFVRALDITAVDAVADEAQALGVPRGDLNDAVASAPVREALRTSVEQAIAAGVFGAPTFVVDGEPIWGVDRLWMVEHWLRHGAWRAPSDDPLRNRS